MRLGIACAGLLAAGGAVGQNEPPGAQTANAANPEEVRLREDAPLRYTVKRGDTLWGISKKFLKDPWQWPEVWTTNNTRVTNPHLIYPGQVLLLVYKDRRPQIVPGNVVAENRGEKLSPHIRELPLEEAIPTIPIDAIRAFLKGPRVVSRDELNSAPYVVEFNKEHIVGFSVMGAYVKDIRQPVLSGYSVVHRGVEYRDPESGELLGYEAIPAADAEVRELGKLSKVELVSSDREVRIGDRLLPQESGLFQANFYPHAPSGAVGGRIISMFDALTQTGQWRIVTINRGSREGMEAGHVLSVLQAGRRVADPYGSGKVQLPDEYAGTLMIFKVGPKVSYGLIMEAERAIHVLDKVEKPRSGERS